MGYVVCLKILLAILIIPTFSFAELRNGDCVRHKFEPSIRYAVTGTNSDGTRFGLTVIEAQASGRTTPRSMLMGYPIHTSVPFVNQMFEKFECNWSETATKIPIYDDWYDPYLTHREVVYGSLRKIEMK